MNVAIYPRVSTGMQVLDGTSLEGQVELCIKKAEELGYHHLQLKIYREEGVSGEDLSRPQMDQLRQDVSNGIISTIICIHPDRLSRDMTDKLIICREFEKYNVQLVFVDSEYKNTPEGQLFFNMSSAIAQYELALIRKRTVRGRYKMVEKGKKIMPMRVPPYGYDFADGKLTINEDEAKYVLMVYQWYVYDNLTLRDIGEKLYNLDALPKRKESRNWSASSIGRILTSEIYIGNYYYNRRESKKIKNEKTSGGNAKRTYILRDKSEWLQVDVPAIIDRGTYELAQQQKEKNTTKLSRNVKHDYLLKSIIKCGKCGRAWEATTYSGKTKEGKKSYPLYRCPNKYPRRYGKEVERCECPTIRTELLDDYVWNLIVSSINDPEIFQQNDLLKTEKTHNKLIDLISLLQKQLSQKEKEKEKVKLMFRKSLIEESEMEKDLLILNKEIINIQKEINNYCTEADMINKNIMSTEKLHSIFEFLKEEVNSNKNFNFDEKRFIVDKLVDKVIINFNANDVDITCIGTLNILIERTMKKDMNKDIVLSTQHQKI
jgi:site-specific DNA recombinase